MKDALSAKRLDIQEVMEDKERKQLLRTGLLTINFGPDFY